MRKATLTYREQDDDSQGCFADYISDSGFSCVVASLFRWDQGPHVCSWRWSNAHGCNLYGIGGVTGHTDIELHPGNVAGDVSQGYQTDSKGCGLPGAEVVIFPSGTQLTKSHPPMIKAQLGVSASGPTLAKLEADMRDPKTGEQVSFELTVR